MRAEDILQLADKLGRAVPAALEKVGAVQAISVIVRGEHGVFILGDDKRIADLIGQTMDTRGTDLMEMYTITFDDIEHETEEAIMFDFGGRLVWLPKSRITLDRDDKTVELEQWLIEEKNIEDLVE